MRATINQAVSNQRDLRIEFNGRGHYRISMDYRGKRISCTTNDAYEIDNFNSEDWEKDDLGRNRRKLGYERLCAEIIAKNYG